MEKCQDPTSATRIKSVDEGAGLQAFVKIRKWYLGASSQTKTARLTSIMQPKQAKTEEETADSKDKWREQMKLMEGMGAEYTRQAPSRKLR